MTDSVSIVVKSHTNPVGEAIPGSVRVTVTNLAEAPLTISVRLLPKGAQGQGLLAIVPPDDGYREVLLTKAESRDLEFVVRYLREQTGEAPTELGSSGTTFSVKAAVFAEPPREPALVETAAFDLRVELPSPMYALLGAAEYARSLALATYKAFEAAGRNGHRNPPGDPREIGALLSRPGAVSWAVQQATDLLRLGTHGPSRGRGKPPGDKR